MATPIHLQIDPAFVDLIDPENIILAAQRTLAVRSELGQVAVTVLVAGDQRLQQLQLDYLGVNKTTDVLAFPSGEIDPDSGLRYLGDVAISYPQCLNQADERGHPVEAELQLLVVHGILHLIGFDHSTPASKLKMWEAQSAILESLGCQVDMDR